MKQRIRTINKIGEGKYYTTNWKISEYLLINFIYWITILPIILLFKYLIYCPIKWILKQLNKNKQIGIPKNNNNNNNKTPKWLTTAIIVSCTIFLIAIVLMPEKSEKENNQNINDNSDSLNIIEDTNNIEIKENETNISDQATSNDFNNNSNTINNVDDDDDVSSTSKSDENNNEINVSSSNNEGKTSSSTSSPTDTNENSSCNQLPLKAICNDGEVSYQDNPCNSNYRGMCSSHGGIKERLGRIP